MYVSPSGFSRDKDICVSCKKELKPKFHHPVLTESNSINIFNTSNSLGSSSVQNNSLFHSSACEIPILSSGNNMWPGFIPDVLFLLTPTEKVIIYPYITCMTVAVVRGYNRMCRGHSITFAQNVHVLCSEFPEGQIALHSS